jgi:hypothetical protein
MEEPNLRNAAIAFLMAIAAVGVDTRLAQKIGIIRDGLPYDGVGYTIEARSLYLAAVRHGWLSTLYWKVTRAPEGIRRFDPAWKLLMTLHFRVLGDGLWQVYTVRFWQVAGLLYLTVWLGRSHGDEGFAICMAAATIMLPTISPNVIAALGSVSTNSFDINTPYLADLRPDILYAVLLVSALVILVERARSPSAHVMILDGLLVGAAVLVKSSTAPLTIGIWGLTLLYFGSWHLGELPRLFRLYAWACAAFMLLFLPWGLSGGFDATSRYIKDVIGPQGAFQYGLRDASVARTLAYYWTWFRYHMGIAPALALAALAAIRAVWPRALTFASSWPDLFAYGGLILILYAIPTLTTAKNYFLGLPAYLVAWALLTILGGGMWRWICASSPKRASIVTSLSLVAVCGGMIYAARIVEAAVPPNYRHNLIQAEAIAHDIRRFVSNRDEYVTYWTAEFPGFIDYLLLDKEGDGPSNNLEPTYDWGFQFTRDSHAKDRLLDTVLKPAKAILMFRDSISVAEEKIFIPRGGTLVLELVREYLDDAANAMCRYKEYRFDQLPGFDAQGGLTAALYVRCPMLR